MSIDAMKQALEALDSACHGYVTGGLPKVQQAITALRAAIEQAQPDELMIWKSRALHAERMIEKFMQPEKAPGYCKNCKQYSIEEPLHAQPEQKPVAWMHPSWIDPDTRGWSNDSFSAIPIEGWVPVYTAPRQWQGLTDEEKHQLNDALNLQGRFPIIDAIEAKLKERNK